MPSEKTHCVYIIAEKTKNWSQTQVLSFNVRARYQLSYPDRIQFRYLNSEFILITLLSYCVCVLCAEGGGKLS